MKALESPEPRAANIVNRAMHALLRAGTHRLNPFMLSLARSGRIPMVAVIHHRGRRSGRAFTTPVAARKTKDGFVVPLTFGKQADWFRNVQAAGSCTIQWKGVVYQVTEPVVVDWKSVRSSFYPAERILVPLVGIEHFVRLRQVSSSVSDLA
jgi:deazaflavin-dependent oxidoreductase (nitroreductase family)